MGERLGYPPPPAVLQSAVLMLRHIGEKEIADRVHLALEKTYKEKQHLTRDVGGTAHTSEFTDAVIANLQAVAVASGS
jgi:isocitrate dehydrogenase (NAD+)